MPDYRMDIKGKLGLGEYSDIYDYMGIVDKYNYFDVKRREFCNNRSRNWYTWRLLY